MTFSTTASRSFLALPSVELVEVVAELGQVAGHGLGRHTIELLVRGSRSQLAPGHLLRLAAFISMNASFR
jgi:hypothetical protein